MTRPNRQIDLASIDRDQFSVKERDGRVLITPLKSKHVWEEQELHLRSLLTDSEGYVLSSGFPKFVNYGENKAHDASFLDALTRGAVTFAEKMDGSLIILDMIEGKHHLRTRGNFDLGDFTEPVVALLQNEHYGLLEWYCDDPFLGHVARRSYSLLFEYTSPENRIVIRYDKPTLTLLGAVDKKTLQPIFDKAFLNTVAHFMGVAQPKEYDLPAQFDALAPIVRGWQDKEGVVASFVASEGGIVNVPRLLKIKATQYTKLHAIKFKLEGKVGKLAFMLGITKQDEVLPKLAEMGIDWEAAAYIKPEMDAYLAKLAEIEQRYDAFTLQLNEIQRAINEYDDARAQRKRFVELVRAEIAEQNYPQSFFGAALKLYDEQPDDAWLQIAATELLQESVGAVRNLMNNPQIALSEMLTAGANDD